MPYNVGWNSFGKPGKSFPEITISSHFLLKYEVLSNKTGVKKQLGTFLAAKIEVLKSLLFLESDSKSKNFEIRKL